MRYAGLAISLLLTAAVAVGCGGGASASGGAANGVKVTLADTKFLPSQVAFPKDQKVALTLTNTGSVEHTFTINDLGIALTVKPDQKPHEYSVGPFTKTGTFDVLCTVAGHKELGMVGKATVK